MRTPLHLVTYETVETLELSVSDMLALSQALFDAARWNGDKGYPATAKTIEALHDRLRMQMDPLIDEADDKCMAFLDNCKKARESARETQETLDYLQRSETNG